MASRLPFLALLCAISCRQGSEASPAPGPSNSVDAVPAPAPSGPLLQVLSDVVRPGVRVRSGAIAARPSWGFTALSLELSRVYLDIATVGHAEQLARLLPERALAVVNGGYFESDYTPSTWLKRGGRELGKKSDVSKGGLLAVAGQRAYLGPFKGLSFEPELAVQSFPLIIEADGRSGIHHDDGKRAARTVVCEAGNELQFIVLAAPRGEGPTLFESVPILRQPWPDGFGCGVALNLDGGPSSGVWFAPHLGAKQRPPLAPVAYAIAILPR